MVENKIYVSTSVPAEKRCSICVFIFVKRVSFLFRSISFYIPILFFLEVSPHFDPYAARQHCTGSRANDSPEREIYLQLHEDRTSLVHCKGNSGPSGRAPTRQATLHARISYSSATATQLAVSFPSWLC
jgi:hypothetical protein